MKNNKEKYLPFFELFNIFRSGSLIAIKETPSPHKLLKLEELVLELSFIEASKVRSNFKLRYKTAFH
jgi:hypothetical protein